MKKTERLDDQGFCRTITAGLNFLYCEAENHGNSQVARIIKIALRDVCLSLEQQSHDEGKVAVNHILGSDLFVAIQFLTKYASIKDADLRKEILRELEPIMTTNKSRGH